MAVNKLYTYFTAINIMAKLAKSVSGSWTDKHFSLDSEDDFGSG